jgi:apolipoprotein N-acyltransferase
MHLVPFAEYFPYEKTFPRLYETLRAAGSNFWEPGKEAVVFEAGSPDGATLNATFSEAPHPGFRFSALVCFEDCFGSISRDFTRRGAEILVNLTNDAWAESLSCQVQHLSMAVFRAVENRRSLVRAATSGQTCAIDPSGKILSMAEPFTKTALTAEVPLIQGRTPYTVWGDLWALFFVAAAIILLLIGIVRYILYKTSQDGQKL